MNSDPDVMHDLDGPLSRVASDHELDAYVTERVGLREVVAYTSPDNHRSQAVMERLGLQRNRSRDFVVHYAELGSWTGLVWTTLLTVTG